jgi:putative membrane protein
MQFKNFIKSKGVLAAFLALLLYGMSIFFIYNTGYSGVPKQVDKMPVTIVNQDHNDKNLTHELKQTLPFKHIKVRSQLSQARDDLKQRKSYLVINVPANFSSQVKQNKQTKLNFYMNDAVQSTASSYMNQVVKSIENSINNKLVIQKGKAALMNAEMERLQDAVKSQQATSQQQLNQQKAQIAALPAAQQAVATQQLQQKVATMQKESQQKIAAQQAKIKQQVNQAYQKVNHSLQVSVHHENYVKTGLNHTLAPFFANLAMYLGAMIGALLLYSVYAKYAGTIGRFKAFINLEIVMGLLAIVGGLINSGVLMAQLPTLQGGFGSFLLNHILLIFAAYNLNTIMVLLLGPAGVAFNVLLTMVQVVAGAGMIPVETMNGFFKFAHNVAPMYYGVQTDFSVIYGGVDIANYQTPFIILAISLVMINLVIVCIRKKQPMIELKELA